MLGSKSGREMDKMNDSSLTVRALDQSVTFEQAEVTLVCRKLFRQELSVENIPDGIVKAAYEGQAPHDMYIGEVVEIIS